MLFLDEAGKWLNPNDIREVWRIHRTCLLVGRRVIGKAMVGSTVNPLDKGRGVSSEICTTTLIRTTATTTDVPRVDCTRYLFQHTTH
jgi:hypothetical protein